MSARQELATPSRQIDADGYLLAAVLAQPSLSEDLRARFGDMQARLKNFIGLTERQRAWVQREASLLGLPVPKVDRLPPRSTQPSAWDPGSPKELGARLKRAVRGLDEKPAQPKKRRRS